MVFSWRKGSVKNSKTLMQADPDNCPAIIRLHRLPRTQENFQRLLELLKLGNPKEIRLTECFGHASFTFCVLQAINSNQRLKLIELDLKGNAVDEDCVHVLVGLITQRLIIKCLELPSFLEEHLVEIVLNAVSTGRGKLDVLNISGTALTNNSVCHLESLLLSQQVTKELNLNHCSGVEGCRLTSDDYETLKEARNRHQRSERIDVRWFDYVVYIDPAEIQKAQLEKSQHIQLKRIVASTVLPGFAGEVERRVRITARRIKDKHWQSLRHRRKRKILDERIVNNDTKDAEMEEIIAKCMKVNVSSTPNSQTPHLSSSGLGSLFKREDQATSAPENARGHDPRNYQTLKPHLSSSELGSLYLPCGHPTMLRPENQTTSTPGDVWRMDPHKNYFSIGTDHVQDTDVDALQREMEDVFIQRKIEEAATDILPNRPVESLSGTESDVDHLNRSENSSTLVQGSIGGNLYISNSKIYTSSAGRGSLTESPGTAENVMPSSAGRPKDVEEKNTSNSFKKAFQDFFKKSFFKKKST